MKSKSPNNTKSHSSLSNLKGTSQYYTSRYFDYWKKVSMEDKINELISFLYEYLSNPNHTDIFSGVLEYGMPQSTYDTWHLRSEELKQAHQQFKLMVAKNLLAKAEQKDNQTVFKRLRRYHPDLINDHKEEQEFRESLADKKNAAAAKLIKEIPFVVGTQVEKTELVDNAIKRRKSNNKPE